MWVRENGGQVEYRGEGRGERGEGSSLKVEKWEEITQQWLIFCNLKRAKWRKPSKRGRSQECMV